jgi:hypothetical protein
MKTKNSHDAPKAARGSSVVLNQCPHACVAAAAAAGAGACRQSECWKKLISMSKSRLNDKCVYFSDRRVFLIDVFYNQRTFLIDVSS